MTIGEAALRGAMGRHGVPIGRMDNAARLFGPFNIMNDDGTTSSFEDVAFYESDDEVDADAVAAASKTHTRSSTRWAKSPKQQPRDHSVRRSIAPRCGTLNLVLATALASLSLYLSYKLFS